MTTRLAIYMQQSYATSLYDINLTSCTLNHHSQTTECHATNSNIKCHSYIFIITQQLPQIFLHDLDLRRYILYFHQSHDSHANISEKQAVVFN